MTKSCLILTAAALSSLVLILTVSVLSAGSSASLVTCHTPDIRFWTQTTSKLDGGAWKDWRWHRQRRRSGGNKMDGVIADTKKLLPARQIPRSADAPASHVVPMRQIMMDPTRRAEVQSLRRRHNTRRHRRRQMREDSGLEVGTRTEIWRRDQVRGNAQSSRRDVEVRDIRDSGPYGAGYGAASLVNVWDIMYMVDIRFGNQTLPMEIDTGSSDTWVVGENFACVDKDMKPWPQEACQPYLTYAGNFTGGWITNTDFRIRYLDGEFLRGMFGYTDVTVAGITVTQQQVAMVNVSHANFQNVMSGIIGLGFPLLTSDPTGARRRYDPIFTNMLNQGKLASPMFSMALSRNLSSSESYLAFGGMPPVDWDPTSMVAVPVQNLELVDNWPEMASEPSYFTVVPDGWVMGDQLGENLTVNATRFPVLIDTGATMTRLPTDMANTLFSLYDPPATYNEQAGTWMAPCNASTPTFGVEFAGRVFYMSHDDLLSQVWGTEEMCIVGIDDAGEENYYILGQSWLHNVVAVFDVGEAEMRFAARSYR